MKNNYDVRTLLDMAQEYLTAENEYRLFLRTYKGGWVSNMNPETYGEYVRKETASRCTFYALRSACKMVSADTDSVIATAKAMNRFEKREGWQVCAYLPASCYGEDRVRRFWDDSDEWRGHFHSTARRYAWTV